MLSKDNFAEGYIYDILIQDPERTHVFIIMENNVITGVKINDSDALVHVINLDALPNASKKEEAVDKYEWPDIQV